MKRWIVRALPLLLLLALCTVSAGAVRSYGSVQNPRYDGYTIRHGVDAVSYTHLVRRQPAKTHCSSPRP